MNEDTKHKLKAYITSFVQRITQIPFTIEELKRAYPFHSLFFPDEALLAFKQQRSLVTKMGQTFFPQIAKIIASEKYRDVHVGWKLEGQLETAKIDMINKILDDLDVKRRAPNVQLEMQEISQAKGGVLQPVKITADLYIGDFALGPLLMEIKTAQPKKEDCVRSKRRLLIFRSLYSNRKARAYVAFYYNPYIYRKNYSWWPTLQILDIDKEVLIGEEMWDYLGGKGTYNEILSIVEEVRVSRFRLSER